MIDYEFKYGKNLMQILPIIENFFRHATSISAPMHAKH
jgi:hypothetical protein